MPLTLLVFAGFYAAARHAVRYADTLAQAVGGKLVLLHVKRASLFDPYEVLSEDLRQAELGTQFDTATALYRLADELPSYPTVEVALDLLPVVAQDQAEQHQPALFVLPRPEPYFTAAAALARDCAELLRASHHPLLVVPAHGPADQLPRRILIAADTEAFTLARHARPLRQLLALPDAELFLAHVSDGVRDDADCGAALHAVQTSGLLDGLTSPELRGYECDNYEQGVLNAVQDTQADLLVVFARQRSYLGELFHHSVTAQLLARSPVPVLVVPAAAKEVPGSVTHRSAALA
jgi:nucleotide-binding universal stress UspA family protein